MPLETLAVTDFRNLAEVRLEAASGLTLITGPNGAGKTSLLEAIYFLGHARSFRTRHAERLIREDRPLLRVTGKVRWPERPATVLGIERERAGQRIRVGGRTPRGLAELVEWLPLQLINQDSHLLLEGGPRYRRRYLDWGLFHVEHEFYGVWRQYVRALKQRNAALRRGEPPTVARAWDQALIEAGTRLDLLRRQHLERLLPLIQAHQAALVDLPVPEFDYRRGWPAVHDTLAEALEAGFETDRRRGFTQYGPHRADLAISIDGVAAQEQLSRGQQKQLATALQLAQAEAVVRSTGRKSIFLVDDLAAELDEAHRAKVLSRLQALDVQAFVTATDDALVPAEGWADRRLFHVKHGRVSEVL